MPPSTTSTEIRMYFETAAREMEFASHVRGRLAEAREIHESDKQTFDRVLEDWLCQKYPSRNRKLEGGPTKCEDCSLLDCPAKE